MPLDASASPAAKTPITTTGELRDMIYDQPEMLEDALLSETTAHLINKIRTTGTKPRANLRLVCRQLNCEYMERCEGRKKLLIKTCSPRYGDTLRTCSAEAIKQVNILHLHIGKWRTRTNHAQRRLEKLKRFLGQCSQMPRLRAVSVMLYVGYDFHDLPAHVYHSALAEFYAGLPLLLSVEKLEQLYVVGICDHKPEKLLAHWERKDRQPSMVNHAPVEHTKSCCGNMLTEDYM